MHLISRYIYLLTVKLGEATYTVAGDLPQKLSLLLTLMEKMRKACWTAQQQMGKKSQLFLSWMPLALKLWEEKKKNENMTRKLLETPFQFVILCRSSLWASPCSPTGQVGIKAHALTCSPALSVLIPNQNRPRSPLRKRYQKNSRVV